MISYEELSKKVKNKEHFHKGLVMEGNILPSVTQPICSKKFLLEVFHGTCWVPQVNETPMKPVQNMPSIEHLTQFAGEAILAYYQNENNEGREERLKLKEYLDQHKVQASFLVKVIAALNQNHVIFEKGYQPPTNHRYQIYPQERAGFDDAHGII